MSDGSVNIGKIAGINIELHWLFILLTLLFYWLSPLFALVWILLFVCVLIHELAHSVTAMRNGLKVTKIILLPFGGASIIPDTDIDPAVEFNMAIAGPIMSFLLGGIFGILVLFTPQGIITYTVQILFYLNILLGFFNLIPAFPMDGGRVLRSYFQKKQGYYKATMSALKVSKYCMVIIVLLTIVYVAIPSGASLGYREFVFVWDLVIVFFLYGGMKAEESRVMLKQNTTGMTIQSAITKNYALISSGTSTKALYGIMKKKKEYLIITKMPDGTFGLINIFDKRKMSSAQTAAELALPIPNISYKTDMLNALAQIEPNTYGVAAVIKGKKLLGVTNLNYINAFLAAHVASRGDGKV